MTPEIVVAILTAVGASGLLTGLLAIWGKTGDRRYSDAQEIRTVLKEQIEDLQSEVAKLHTDLRDCQIKHLETDRAFAELRVEYATLTAQYASSQRALTQLRAEIGQMQERMSRQRWAVIADDVAPLPDPPKPKPNHEDC